MQNNTLECTNIKNLIYEIRGKQVMLDSDLARLYDVETKRINEAVRRNKEKFPDRFAWKLTNEELNNLWSQNATANVNSKSRSNPRVFTEQGVAMLATILKSPVATQVSIAIMDAFVAMKKYISNNLLEQKYINEIVLKHDERINLLENAFNNFKEKNNHIFFDGQIYDAYSKIVEILKLSKDELIIVDAYADKTVLDMISNLDVKVILITRKNKLLKKLDIDKYNEQYKNLRIIYDDTFHDRYFIIDNKEIYHSGTSINYAGKRVFSLNKLEDEEITKSLMKKVNKIKI